MDAKTKKKNPGSQYFPKSTEYFNAKTFLPGYNFNELGVFEFFTWVAWKRRSWVVHVAHSYAVSHLSPRLGSGSIKRHMRKLQNDGFLLRWKLDYDEGNKWLVSPRLLWEPLRKNYRYWEDARVMLDGMPDQNDPGVADSTYPPDHFDPGAGSILTTQGLLLGSCPDQIDPQNYTLNSLLKVSDAPRQMCPVGQDQNGNGVRREGVLTDTIKSYGVAALKMEMERREKEKTGW